jgi:hypothetical protein
MPRLAFHSGRRLMNSVQADRELTIPKAGTAMFFRSHLGGYSSTANLLGYLLRRITTFVLATVTVAFSIDAGKHLLYADSRSVPNIIFILADDLGYGDLGCYGQTKIRTPNIDRIAAEGMRFTNFYCGCTVCAPSRCTLMTGKHLGHATVRDNLQRGAGLEGQHAMEPGTVTVAQLLKKAGYATAIVGKWGLGMPEDRSSPLDFGFDHHYGYLCQGMAHTYYPPYLWRDNRKEPLEGNPPYAYGQRGPIAPGGRPTRTT